VSRDRTVLILFRKWSHFCLQLKEVLTIKLMDAYTWIVQK